MSQTTSFTDNAGDTLKVSNYGTDGSGSGALTIREAGRNNVFELNEKLRLPIAKEILAGTDAILIEGQLPATEFYTYGGVKKIKGGTLVAEITEAELDYFLTTGKERLAIADALTKALAEEEKARQERLAAADKRKARRDELAREFANTPWANYSTAPTSTKTAIDRIIELEDAAK